MKEPGTWCLTLKSRVRLQKPKMPSEPPGPAEPRGKGARVSAVTEAP